MATTTGACATRAPATNWRLALPSLRHPHPRLGYAGLNFWLPAQPAQQLAAALLGAAYILESEGGNK
jgi:hypothetical protein